MSREAREHEHALIETVIGTATSVERIESKVDKVVEAIGGNEQMGHKGIAERLEEIEDAHVSFKEEFVKFKSDSRKEKGWIAGFFLTAGFAVKWLLFKLGLFS